MWRVSAFFHSLELKRSAPGNLQQRVGSGFDNRPDDFAKSNEISSSVDSRPSTRDSSDRIPFCELPMNFYILGQCNRNMLEVVYKEGIVLHLCAMGSLLIKKMQNKSQIYTTNV